MAMYGNHDPDFKTKAPPSKDKANQNVIEGKADKQESDDGEESREGIAVKANIVGSDS